MRHAPSDLVADLSIGRRQMVEVARAFTVTNEPLRLVILDEPTSSLDAVRAGQLLRYVRAAVGQGISCVFISHILKGGRQFWAPHACQRSDTMQACWGGASALHGHPPVLFLAIACWHPAVGSRRRPDSLCKLHVHLF